MTAIYADLKEKLKKKNDVIQSWFEEKEKPLDLPLYTSVDIRDAGFKLSVVDTNLFPAGFNNVCDLSLKDAESHFKKEIKKRVPDCKSILILTEEHTRNSWYLENIYSIESMIKNMGFQTKVSTFFDKMPDNEKNKLYLTVKTALDNSLDIYNIQNLIEKVCNNTEHFDLILLNNDLSKGTPDALKQEQIPIYPKLKMGWHNRHKSTHFSYANNLIEDFSQTIDCDPWLISSKFNFVNDVSIQNEGDRAVLAGKAETLLSEIQSKYDEYGISEKPFIFLKANAGTYGMGVMPIEDPEQILNINRKGRNKLSVGKESQEITSFILQEGVPSINQVDQTIAEACIYSIANHFVGGFYRVNDKRSTRENLNAKGMRFVKMCTDPNSKCSLKRDPSKIKEDPAFKLCGIAPDSNLDIYRILARLSGVAAALEACKN